MGKQSSRLYFKGKDHKDIYFQGHYHDAMYLTDSGGNATLVWEKIKGTLVKYVSMLSYVNGKYYAVVESTENAYALSAPTLYEGASLERMHEKGKILGDEDETVQARCRIMYADSGELTIIYAPSAGNGKISRIPIGKNGADMGNISHDIENGVYKFSNYDGYFYGNGNNSYHYNAGERAFYKNDDKIKENINRIINVNGKLTSIGSVIYNTSEFEGYLQFDAFNGNEEFRTYNIDLTAVIEHARERFAEEHNWITTNLITLTNVSRVMTGYYGIAVTGNGTGYVLVKVNLRKRMNNSNYYFETYYKLKINFDNFALVEIKNTDEYDDYTFHSYMIGAKYRAQAATEKRSTGSRNGILYGLTGDDYENDVFITYQQISDRPGYVSASSFTNYKICSLAYNSNILTVGISDGASSELAFIVIDVKNKTAKWTNINIYAD